MAQKRLKIYTEGLSGKEQKSVLKIVSKLLAEYPDQNDRGEHQGIYP